MAKTIDTAVSATASAATKKRRSTKKSVEAPLTLNLEAGVGAFTSDRDAALAGLLADLAIDDLPAAAATAADEVIEPALPEVPAVIEAGADAAISEADLAAAVTVVEPTDADLDAAIGAVEVAEHYAEATDTAELTAEGDVPTEPVVKEAAASTSEKKEKKPKKERVYFSDKTDRIKHRLGDKLGDYMLLEVDDALLEGDALVAKQQATLDIIKGMSVKEKNRASLLFDFASGKSSKLNEVMARAFSVLNADGKLQTGDNGNLHKNLLAKPYSASAARAMGRNTINMFAKLKLLIQTGKGEYVANPNSLLLAKINSILAAPAATAVSSEAGEPVAA